MSMFIILLSTKLQRMKMKLKHSIDNALQSTLLHSVAVGHPVLSLSRWGADCKWGCKGERLRMLGLGRITIPGGVPGAGQALGERRGSCSGEPS